MNKYHRDIFTHPTITKPTPVSSKLGPYVILEPKLDTKKYHWCSCGLSRKQPYCDMSHKGSKFSPISFKLGEKCDSMSLCGCKLSTSAPFCDGKTCVILKQKEDLEIDEKVAHLEKITSNNSEEENNKIK